MDSTSGNDFPDLGLRLASTNKLQVFFGCPHQCRSTENMSDNLARLLFSSSSPSPGDRVNPTMEIASKKVDNYFVRAAQVDTAGLLEELGRSVNEINGSFFASNIPSLLSILNIYSDVKDPAQQVRQIIRLGKYHRTFLDKIMAQNLVICEVHRINLY
jgi:hypothetical protein